MKPKKKKSAKPVYPSVAELLVNTQRLEWLIANSAYVAHSRDGDVCWVMMRHDEESDFEVIPQTVRFSADEAIDAAMKPCTKEVAS